MLNHRVIMGAAERPQAADAGTLIEALVADSPDDNPANAPHLTQICNAFAIGNITHPLCGGDSGARGCYADCDASGTLDVFDYLCFQNSFLAGDLYADCDGDGRLSSSDFLCFQGRFAAGCP